MKNIFFALLVISLVLLAGCLVNDSMRMRNQLSSARAIDIFKSNEAGLNEPEPGPTPCSCMYCDRQTYYVDSNGNIMPLGPFASLFAESSLFNGKCYFEQCNVTTFNDTMATYLEDPVNVEKIPRYFGYGQGGSFLEFGEAVKYCKSSVGYSGKWMIGAHEAPPAIPSKRRAQCMLEKNVIPVYIYYTKGEAIDEARAREIGQRLNGVGPVIISTEVEFDPAKIEEVKRQVIAIDHECPDCLVAVTPRLNDFPSLDALFFADPAVADKIDIVGQGVVLNDNPSTCNIETLIGERMYFSRRILQRYAKPSIWLYFGISPQQRDPAAGVQCTWSDIDAARGYTYLFQMSQALVSSGVIGVLNYQYADGLDPKPCVGAACDFGLVEINPITHQAEQKLPQFRGWFEGCRKYVGSDGGVENAQSPVVYSRNGKGNVCTFGGSNRMLQSFVQLEPGVNPYNTIPMGEDNIGYQCRACISYDVDPPSLLAASSAPVDPPWCTLYYPVLDANPDRYDIDPVLMRAIIGQESDFANCDPDKTVSYVVDTPENRTLCSNPLGLKESSEIIDVGEGRALVDRFCPGFDIERRYYDRDGVIKGCLPISSFSGSPNLGDCITCAMGMAQCTDYPGWIYEANPAVPMPAEVKLCSGEKYNPFDPKDTFCCGAYKIASFYQEAQRFVDNNPLIDYSPDEKEWYTAYFAVQMYHDGYRTVGSDYNLYLSQRLLEEDGYCAGNLRYVSYLQECLGRKYAYNVLSKYRALMDIDKCRGVTNECRS
jgi:hypothetical protein